MKNVAYLILGSCLTLHIPANYAAASRRPVTHDIALRTPVHRFEHAGSLASAADVTGEEYAHFIFETVQSYLPASYKNDARKIAGTLIDEANRQHFDPLLLVAVIRQESRFNPNAIGRHGEIGLMQIKPSTARWLANRTGIFSKTNQPSDRTLAHMLHDPGFNIRLGARYLAQLKKSFHGRDHSFLSAYNMGPQLLRHHIKSRQHPRAYSDRVFAKYLELTAVYFSDEHPEFDRKIASNRTMN
jgi:soluble lytic murein transglycosylase